ncbi:MAG TPA: hypothetical protein HPP87_12840 [Planctomycetes bacterium]|nr:hypothetical protein [Planctomycetota bacterium]HIJ72223.1 hypothetical protein [Planctomycetota bacterium]
MTNNMIKFYSAVLLGIAAMLFPPPVSVRADFQWEHKLTDPNSAIGDSFGGSVSISKNLCVVGAPADDYNGVDSGSAYIFRFDGFNWVPEARLLALDGSAGDLFGVSVSLDGELCLIGASGDEDNGDNTGSAYIFRFQDPNWIQEAKLTAFDGVQNDEFGTSVSVSGNRCVIGASGDDDNGDGSGSGYVFRFDGENWLCEHKLLASDGRAGDLFGCSVSISGDLCLTGAKFDDDNGDKSGSAYIFRYEDPNWVEQAKLTPSDGTAGDFFSSSVSLDGNLCLIGAHGDDDRGEHTGSAYVFRYSEPNWVQEAKLAASDGGAWDFFGRSVALSGDLCLVGAYMDSSFASEAGSAYLFRFADGFWQETASLSAADRVHHDHFGWSVSLDSGNVLVGAIRKDDYTGAAYSFRPCPSADLTDDCFVDIEDFAVLADWWLRGEDL